MSHKAVDVHVVIDHAPADAAADSHGDGVAVDAGEGCEHVGQVVKHALDGEEPDHLRRVKDGEVGAAVPLHGVACRLQVTQGLAEQHLEVEGRGDPQEHLLVGGQPLEHLFVSQKGRAELLVFIDEELEAVRVRGSLRGLADDEVKVGVR